MSRQAGALSLDWVRGEQSSGLHFDSHDDALNFAAKVVKDGQEFLAANDRNVAKRYIKGDCEIVLHVSISAAPRNRQIAFRVIPAEYARDELAFKTVYANAGYIQSYGQDNLMLIGTGDGPQRTEQIVSSLVAVASGVRLEGTQERSDFDGDILAAPCFAEDVLKVSGRSGKREVDSIKSSYAKLFGTSDDGLVERVSQVVDDGGCASTKPSGGLGGEPELVEFIAGLSIYLLDFGVWVTIEESLAS